MVVLVSWYLDNGLKGACGARKRSAYLLVNLVFYGLAKISDKIILSRPSRQKAEDESRTREHEGGLN